MKQYVSNAEKKKLNAKNCVRNAVNVNIVLSLRLYFNPHVTTRLVALFEILLVKNCVLILFTISHKMY